MASAQLMEEELQQSVVLSEDDADFDYSTKTSASHETHAIPASRHQRHTSVDLDSADLSYSDHVPDADMLDPEINNQSGVEVDEDEDEDDEDDNLDHLRTDQDVSDEHMDVDETPDEAEDSETGDGDRDEDYESPRISFKGTQGTDTADEGDDNDDDEGVGAVKIKPGETDDDDEVGEEGSEQFDSQSQSDEESEGAAAWEEPDDNPDEDSDIAAQSTCLICKQDEDNEPVGEFEPLVACGICGENGETYQDLVASSSNSIFSTPRMRSKCKQPWTAILYVFN
jgi:histone acetyltransferase SAS3